MVRGDPPPSQVGKYRLIAKLGEGGAATVYLAVASGPAGVNKLLVVKILRPELAEDPDVLAMFLEEARLCTRLSHPNIVQTMEVGMDAGRYFIVMEHLEGKPLSALMRVPGIGPDERVHLVAEALEGLHYAHELADYDGTPLHVVHRDVSPQNLFVTYDGHAKLLDFGVAKARSSSTKTDLGVIKGKPRYMSPEQVQGVAIDRRADVFAAGVVLVEAASGRRLWGDKNDVAVLYALGSGYIPRPAELLGPEAHPQLVRILSRALAPSPDDRYATAAALQEDLEAYLRSLGVGATARSIGRALQQQFAADRIRLNAAIDQQVRAAAHDADLKVVSLSTLDAWKQANERPEPSPQAVPGSMSAHSIASAPPRSSRYGAAKAVVAGVIGAAVLVVVGWDPVRAKILGVRGTRPAPALASSAPAQASTPVSSALVAAAPAAPVAAAGSVTLSLQALPREARFILDGKVLDSNPFHARLPRDEARHALRVEAPGFVPQLERLDLSRDAFVQIVLLKGDSAAPPAEKPVAGGLPPSPVGIGQRPPPAAAASPSDMNVSLPDRPSAQPPKDRPIDPTDPYAR
jgi:serine/threonine-protein kinase